MHETNGVQNGTYDVAQTTATKLDDGSVDVEKLTSKSWAGTYWDVNVDEASTPFSIKVTIKNINTEVETDKVQFGLYIGSSPLLNLSPIYVPNNGEDFTFIFPVTQSVITNKNIQFPIKRLLVTVGVKISYNIRVSIIEGIDTTISEIYEKVEKPKLLNKKAIFLGDSITALSGNRSWVDKFVDITGCIKVANVAVNGATLKDKNDTVLDGNPTANSNNTLSNQVQKIINNNYDVPDIIVIAIGTNGGIDVDDTRLSESYVKNNALVPLTELDRKTVEGAFRWSN
jgi:hypothetical protein